MKSLPNKFAAINIDNGTVVNFERQSDGLFKAEWDAGYNDGKHIQFYDESTIKAWLNTYLTMTSAADGAKTSEESVLSKIVQFSKETDTDVIIDKTGFVIQYRDFDFVRINSLDKLQEMMDIVTAFHKVMHGKQTQ